jgi:outer membrane protein OmpA-like peptidoglycan-associated protein
MIASVLAAGVPASAQTKPDCLPRCAAEVGIEDRLNLDTGAFLRATIGGGTIPFAVGESRLGKGARARLDQVIAWLKAYPERTVRLDGHADDPGSDEYNLALGDKRANSVLAYLVANGIEPSRLSSVTFGRSRPLSRGAGANQNGRVEIMLGK